MQTIKTKNYSYKNRFKNALEAKFQALKTKHFQINRFQKKKIQISHFQVARTSAFLLVEALMAMLVVALLLDFTYQSFLLLVKNERANALINTLFKAQSHILKTHLPTTNILLEVKDLGTLEFRQKKNEFYLLEPKDENYTGNFKDEKSF